MDAKRWHLYRVRGSKQVVCDECRKVMRRPDAYWLNEKENRTACIQCHRSELDKEQTDGR